MVVNDIKSQDDLGQRGRSVDVLTSTIDELAKVKKQLEIAKKYLKKLTHKEDWRLAREGLKQIEELDK